MAGYITALPVITTLTGLELLEVSQLSTSVTITAGTISALASDNSFNDSGSGFLAAGFAVDDRVKVTGFTGNVANNILVGVITALTADKMTIGGTDGDVIVDDAAGESVTIAKWVSHRATAAEIALGAKDTDGTLAANSDDKIATQKAVKTYVDASVTGLLDFKGTTDCSANPNYPAASKGDVYIVSVSGKIGGASGTTVDVGDWYVATADNAGGTEASVGASWGHMEHNLVSALTGASASTTEVLTGTDNSKLVTPDALAALWEQGSDVASAGTVSLGEGGYFNITGTTTITDIDFATDKAGRKAWVKFAGALILTHNASTLILPGGASITTAAGDMACFVSEGSDVVRCVAYQKASGRAITTSYRVGFFFTTAPSASEVLALHVASEAFTFPANFASPDSKGAVGTNPAASFALDVQKNGSTIGTITISTGGAFTFATSSGTSKSIAVGDVIKVVGPSSADASIANVAVTLVGAY